MRPSALKRVRALVMQELFISRHSLEILFDVLVFPMMNVILFGFIARFVGSHSSGVNSQYLILGVLLWEIITIVQYNMTVSSLWSVWSHNLTNIFIAPTSAAEYLSAHALAAIARGAVVVGCFSVGTYFAFGFNLLQVGPLNLLLFFINLSLFAFWVGLVLLGLIFRYGTRIQAIAWGTIFLFQPLTASFFPVSALPGFLQAVAFALPPTYIFEAARQAFDNRSLNVRYMLIGSVLNLVYFGAAIAIFRFLFRRSKTTGQFARNDLG